MMKRRTLPSIFAGILVAIAAIFVAGTSTALAQQDPYCCNYVIDVAGLPATCFPMTIVTTWGTGPTVTQTFTVAANGVYVDAIPNCPPFPALTFNSVAVAFPPGCTPAWTVVNSCCIQILIR